ncbi:MAG: NADH-quinone oxidoreductase subunit L [Anaerosomatales bacterium]|nr:NADH-quinone oxidoreductase subunit L [Anaerosomatales bacterium]
MAYVALIPLLPALAFAVMAPLSRGVRNRVRWLGVAGVGGALLLSLVAFASVWPGGHEGEAAYHASWPIAQIGGVDLSLGILLDPLAAIMLLVVTIVGVCVQVYSLGYMHRDERVGWYFAVLTLFTAAMLALVLSDNFLMFYMAWEVMGLCSYLLIGFWHEQEAPRKASQKAFLTTRVGDVGFAIGLAIMYATVGSFDFDVVLGSAGAWAPGVATAVALLLLFGAMGKSAQVPLHVWLPDAMAGPTPASALIHAATMVAAGVFLVARALPIFEASGVALTVTMAVGAITALLGGLLAAVQHDVKKVLAYSTISQLGYMFLAIGAGGAIAGMFHLVTHAFFKSLLFLGAGVIIHAAHTQDMREMGGLARHLPVTSVTFGIGALALAGIFPFSGFWSKDEILYAVWHDGHYVTFAVALLAAFVTAFYVARLWFRVFIGPVQTENLAEGHAEMLAPMGVLAAITAVIGFSAPFFSEFLGHAGHWPDPAMAISSSAVSLSGLALGWWAYGRTRLVLNTRSLKERSGHAYTVLTQKYYFDVTYEHFIIRPYMRAAESLSRFDGSAVDGAVNGAAGAWKRLTEVAWSFDGRVIDGFVNGVARAARASGGALRRIQAGRVQTYQRSVLGALVLLMLWIVVKGA